MTTYPSSNPRREVPPWPGSTPQPVRPLLVPPAAPTDASSPADSDLMAGRTDLASALGALLARREQVDPPVPPELIQPAVPIRHRYDRWWTAGEELLEHLFHEPEALDELLVEFGLDRVPRVAAKHALIALHASGPERFTHPDLPPRTHDEWRELVAAEVVDTVARRQHEVDAARRDLRHLRRPKTTLRRLAAVVQASAASVIVLDDDRAQWLVERARSLVLAGPHEPGAWVVPDPGSDPTEAALGLVVMTALRLAVAEPDFAGTAIPIELVEDDVRGSTAWGPDAVRTMVIGRSGPYGVTDDGRLVTSRPRAGAVVIDGPPGQGKSQIIFALMSTTP